MRAVHDVEGLLITEMIAETEIIGAVLEADHDEGEAERHRTVCGAWRTGRRSRPIVCDSGFSGDRVVRDTEEQAVGVSDSVELELNLLDERIGAIIALWDLDGEKMRIALIIRGIQTEHRVLLRSGKMVVSVGDLHGGDTGLDHIFIRMGKTVEEVGGRLLCVVSETGVDVQDVSAEVVGVGDGILSVDFVCFDVEHSR